MRSRAKIMPSLHFCFVMAGLLTIVSMLWLAATHTIVQGAGEPVAGMAPQAYLPIVARLTCPGNVVVNGGFEQGDDGWYQHTTGIYSKAHDLIGSEAEGYHPHEGAYAAKLGGYEGVSDTLTQTVSIPSGGQLSFWWQMGTYETSIYYDHFIVDLLALDGSRIAVLAHHGIEGPESIWQQDVVDVSPYAGRTLVLRFDAYNDNYYFSWFDIDDVCLRPAW